MGKKSSEYNTWISIKQRCYNPNDISYKYYGARGIKMSDEWFNSSKTFLNDMGSKPTPKHSIDRIDCNGDYCKENCRWATREEQNNNRRNTIYITFDSETKLAVEWSKIFGIKYHVFMNRLKDGFTMDEIKKKPVDKRRRCKLLVFINGVGKTLREWSEISGIKYDTLSTRYQKGCSPEELLLPLKKKGKDVTQIQ